MESNETTSISEADEPENEPPRVKDHKMRRMPPKRLFESTHKSVESDTNVTHIKEINDDLSDEDYKMTPMPKTKPMDYANDKKEVSLDEDYDSSSSALDNSAMEKFNDMNKLLKNKNAHIKEMLADLQVNEEENKALRAELSHMKDKLTEVTLRTQEQAIFIKNSKTENSELIEQIKYLKQSESAFQSQIIEMSESKKIAEKNMDEFIVEMDLRIGEWKNLLNSKEVEIKKFKAEISQLKQTISNIDQKNPEYFNNIIKQRDRQLNDLQEKLSSSLNELSNANQTIERLKKEDENMKLGLFNENKEDSNIIENYESELKSWIAKCEDLEESLRLKEQELAETLQQITYFENGDLKLNDVIETNKKHRQQIKVRDDQIKKLISENNKCNSLMDQFQMENSLMRKKLNLPQEQLIPTDNVLTKYERCKKDFVEMSKQKLVVEEQNVSLKIRLRQKEKTIKRMYEYARNQGIVLPEQFLAIVLSEENLKQQAFDSNDGFVEGGSKKDSRKGSINYNENHSREKSLEHEEKSLIFDGDSFRKYSKSSIDTNMDDFKNDLYDFDSQRGGEWHHVIMKLLTELKVEKGNIEQLNEMLKKAKQETISTLELLANESAKNANLKQKLNQAIDHDEYCEADDNIRRSSYSENKYLKNNNAQYTSLLHENLKHFHKQFETLFDNMSEIYSLNSAEKEKWLLLEEQYKTEIHELTITLDSVKNSFSEFKPIENIAVLLRGIVENNEVLRKLSDVDVDSTDINQNTETVPNDPNSQFLYEVIFKKFYFERKSAYLEESLKLCRGECKNMKSENHRYRMETFDKIKDYEMRLQKLMFQTVDLRNILRNSIPFNLFLKQNIKLNEYILKYRRVLNSIEENYPNNENTNEESNNTEAEKNNENLEKIKLKIDAVEKQNMLLQENQNELINKFHSSWNDETDSNVEAIKDIQLKNEDLKIENLKFSSTIQKLEHQLHYYEQKKLVEDLEINILNHQILDLQSASDNKAVIAKLGGEILVSHLHKNDMHEKLDVMSKELEKERKVTKQLKDMINEKDVQFDNYVSRTNFKISFLCGILQAFREQYQGSVPIAIMENIQNLLKEAKEKLKNIKQIENNMVDLQNEKFENSMKDIISKVNTKSLCTNQDMADCPHFIELEVKSSKWNRDKSAFMSKYKNLEKTYSALERKYETLEESLLMLSFSLDNSSENVKNKDSSLTSHFKRTMSMVELTDMDEEDVNHVANDIEKPIPKPRKIIKTPLADTLTKMQSEPNDDLPGSPTKSEKKLSKVQSSVTAIVQTDSLSVETAECQTSFLPEVIIKSDDSNDTELKNLTKSNESLKNTLEAAKNTIVSKSKLIADLETEISLLKGRMSSLENIIKNRNESMEELQMKYNSKLKMETVDLKKPEEEIEKLKAMMDKLKSLETEKNAEIDEYKELLKVEKSEHIKTSSLAQKQITDMKVKMESLEKEHNGLKDLLTKPSHIEAYNVSMEKYRNKVLNLEEKCFQLQRDIDHEHAALISVKSECERWKNLASERFANMESMKKHFEDKHGDEINSLKAENAHWLTEYSNCKDELSEAKIQLNELKTSSLKQIDERNIIIEGLYSYNCTLKQKILNLQNIISASDPTIDLSSIIEVDDENSTAEDTERKDFSHDTLIDHVLKNIDADSMKNKQFTTWPDTVIERLRREKQMINKQNVILRKQIKIVTARERRTKLELQNIKSQISKGQTFIPKTFSNNIDETAMLIKKIEKLEMELSEKNSNPSPESNKTVHLGLWEKQKKWQENAERWKQKFLEKCAEFEKLQKCYESSRVVVQRLERDKRVLDSRLSKHSREGFTPSTITGDSDGHLEFLLQDKERLEEEVRKLKNKLESNLNHSTLLQKLEAQQRRLAAYELLEKGKDTLINEYDKLLAQNTLLAKQNIKLETEILENQFVSAGKRLEPDGSDGESNCCRRLKQQNQHLENYIKILKEENSQLIAKNIEANSVNNVTSSTPTLSQAKRIANLEKTVLTLRGLISKQQSDNKRLLLANMKLSKESENSEDDMMLENLKMEIEQMRENIREKDDLLTRAKELLKKAAEKEKSLTTEIKKLREK